MEVVDDAGMEPDPADAVLLPASVVAAAVNEASEVPSQGPRPTMRDTRCL